MMQIHFNKIRDFVYEVNLDITDSRADLIKDLETEYWTPDQDNLIERYYLEWGSIQSPRLQKLRDYACSDEFRYSVIDQLYNEPLFSGYWSIGPDRMKQVTNSFGTILRDQPGYHCGLHLDNRLLVATGMIYFCEQDDYDISTEFYTSCDKTDPVRITTGFGRGWVAANMHDSWHDGWNRSVHDRYSMIMGVSLKI